MSCTDFLALTTQYFSRDSERLYGPIAQALVSQVPYISVLKSGTFPAQVAQTLIATAQGRPYMGTSLAKPVFSAMSGLSGLCGSCSLTIDKNGTNQYRYSAEINQGKSDKICLNQGYAAYKESLLSQLNAYQTGTTQIINADIRWQLFERSGVKMVVQAGQSIGNMITGGEYAIDTAIPAVEATAQLDFSTLHGACRHMTSVLRAKQFGNGGNAHARFIASPDELEYLRGNLGGAAGTGGANIVPLGQVAAGGNEMAQKALTSYLFEPLYRGLQFGQDQLPLRLNWNGASYDPVNPDVSQAGTEGTVAVTNPAWVDASHEVAFLFFDGSFERQVPAPWTGEGKVKFARQMFGGEIQFINHPDMDANMWQDWGVMAYRIGRAFKPLFPWFVLPIIYKRCEDATTLATCTGVSG